MGRKELGETGFFVVYMLLFTTLSGAFVQAFQISAKVMDGLLDFVKVFFPSFCLSLSASQGSATGYGVYQISMFAMYLAENVLIKMVLPGIQIYFFLAMANQLLKEQRFSKLVELIRSFLRWVMKTLFGIVMGLQGVQLLIMPISDQVKKNVLMKGLSVVPGVGGALNTVAETVVGTGTVIKSAIGVGGVIAICLICLIPLIQVGMYAAINLAGAAMIQPITDKRIVASVSVAAESGKLLTRFVSMGALMFLCCLAMVIGMTNVR
jgi:stage III sporulation protein AE